MNHRKALVLFFLVLVCYLVKPHSLSAAPLTIDISKTTFQQIGTGIQYQVIPKCSADKSKSARCLEASISTLKDSNQWQTLAKNNPSFGLSKNTLWLRFSLTNPTDIARKRLLEIANPTLDSIEVFQFINNELVNQELMGDQLSFYQRPIIHRNFLINLDFQPKQSKEIYLKITTTGLLLAPINIWSPVEFDQTDQLKTMSFGLFFGIMIVMFFYNTFLFFTVRSRAYLLYSMYVLSFLFFQSILHGFSFQYLWTENIFLQNFGHILFIGFTGFFINWFCLDFLEIHPKKHSEPSDQIIYYIFCFFIIAYIVQPLLALQNTQNVYVHYLVVPNCLFALISGFRQLSLGLRAARFYLFGWIFFIASVMVMLLNRVGLVEYNSFLDTLPLLGAVVEVVFFSLALADRINYLKLQLAHKNKTLLKQKKGLLRAQKTVNKVVSELPGMLIIVNDQLKIESVNHSACQLLEYQESQLKGQFLKTIFPEAANDDFQEKFWHKLEQFELEKNYQSKTRKNIPVLFSRVLIDAFDHSDAKPKAVCIAQDLTHQKAMEEQLRQSQRLQTVSTLTGGIAHNINNILMPIIGNAELLLEDKTDKASLECRQLETIKKAGYRGADLVKSLLRFCGHLDSHKTIVALDKVILQSVALFQPNINEKLKFRIKGELPQGNVLASRDLLDQVIMNMITNAVQAIGDSTGSIVLTLTRTKLNQSEISSKFLSGIPPGEYFCLKIKDDGPGMDKNTMKQIFDPFFTTHSIDQGMGLGLSISLGIIQEYKGTISVHSELGKGTALSVYLPVSKEITDTQNNSDIPLKRLRHKKPIDHHILLVDDEEMILLLLEKSLQKKGYKITTAHSAIAALKLYQKSPNDFSLVVTDNNMPELSGAEFAKQLLEINKDLPIIIITGSSIALNEEQSKAIGIKAYFLKPVNTLKLCDTIHHYLK